MRALIVIAGFLALGAASPDQERVRLKEAFDTVQRAVEARDLESLKRLVHARFVMQHGLGQSEDRETWLRIVADGNLPRQTAERAILDEEIFVAGDTGLIRSLVRLRDRRASRDMWLRGTAVFVREGDGWLQLNQQSTLLADAPLNDLIDAASFEGQYTIPGRPAFAVEARVSHLGLRWASGAVLPLVPLGTDRFAAGPGSYIQFVRHQSGQITGAQRLGTDQTIWWNAEKVTPP